ncbi:3-phenylpropionate/cinnamic acid dioxygenase subunit beta [Metallosphaera sedula]|nr:3-phenylpropionate/cinnamic acid dioxygenase subunit beta [Metallosphaera sedula]
MDEVYFEVLQFINHETYLLDHYKFDEWLKLLTDDVKYVMARRVWSEGVSTIDMKAPLMAENKYSLEARVKKLVNEFSWSEVPKSLYRHMVSGVFIEAQNNDEIKVRSNVLFLRHRPTSFMAEIPEYEIFSYEREDILRGDKDGLKLAYRLIIPDLPVIPVHALSNLY